MQPDVTMRARSVAFKIEISNALFAKRHFFTAITSNDDDDDLDSQTGNIPDFSILSTAELHFYTLNTTAKLVLEGEK